MCAETRFNNRSNTFLLRCNFPVYHLPSMILKDASTEFPTMSRREMKADWKGVDMRGTGTVEF